MDPSRVFPPNVEMEICSESEIDVDLLNVSLHNISIDDEPPIAETDEVNFTPFSSSTPVISKKHQISPSKLEPAKKKSNLSGVQCKKRSEMLQEILKEKYVESPGRTTSHADIMDTLGIDNKNIATRSVKQAFSSATNDRKKGEYRNIRRAISYETTSDELSLELHENSVIHQLQQEVIIHKNQATVLMDKIKVCVNDPFAKSLISLYNKEMECVSKITDSIDKLYETELELLLKGKSVLNASEKTALVKEFEELAGVTNLGIRTGEHVAEVEINSDMFEVFQIKFAENCPMLAEIIHDLFPHDGRCYKKGKGAMHALALLASLRNKQCRNDLTLVFSLMLVSYGGGCRMINMLNKVGITLHWDTLMNFLDKQLEKKIATIKSVTPLEVPLLLLMDNINIYQGNKRHHPLFKSYGPHMWNFTVRGLFIPQTDDIDHLLMSKETTAESQHDVTKFTSANLLIKNNKEHSHIWENQVDDYLTRLLKDCLSFKTRTPLNEMSEAECNKCLKNKRYDIIDDLKITLKDNHDNSRSGIKSKTVILPLSLENNSTVAGTAVILDQFGKEFSIPSAPKVESLPFDSTTKSFCLKKAREHAEFNLMLSHHKGTSEHESSPLSVDEEDQDNDLNYDNDGYDDDNGGDDDDKEEEENNQGSGDRDEFRRTGRRPETTLRSLQELFKMQDRTFNSTYDSLKNKLWSAIQSDNVDRLVKEVAECDHFQSVRDHLGRSLLHVAVEQQNVNLVRCLLHAGVNPNVKELCGITPLLLGVVVKNKEICQMLVNSHASVRGPLFTNVPSPLVAALRMKQAEIYEILNPSCSDNEDECVASYDPGFTTAVCSPSSHQTSGEKEKRCDRATPGFITGLVGDVGTCKTNRGVMSRADAYSWIGIIPGDLHTKGYLSEACLKEQGVGGFHYLVSKVLKRPKLTTEAFKKKKFSEGNLDRIREAVRDGARSYGMAAVFEFQKSDLFPSKSDQQQCLRSTGSHTKVLLERFKQWLQRSMDASTSFHYRSRMFLFYGPLLELFDVSTKECWGKARETCYLLQVPIYAQLNFRNYYRECFIHAVNFLGKWPLAFRNILSNNCSINISGRRSCGIELDAYVESEIVQPLKVYMTGHTSVKMCERLMGSIDIIKACREAYTSKAGFDVHSTTKHSVADPFHDQLKGAWFCLQKRLLDPVNGEEYPCCYPLDKGGEASGKVPKSLVNVEGKGIQKLSENFDFKLYESFPDLRYKLLCNE